MSKGPYIPPETNLPEITLKGVILAIILTILLAAANAYLGLYAGLTVSASIPAAVISMMVLRFFRTSNILENNAVQTAASAGESLAAGVIFTFPALILMGYWESFNYWETVLIALSGGLLGVLFTIPLRSALIVREKLLFPEGVATAEVLKTGQKSSGGSAIKYLLLGGALGAIIKICVSGFKLWTGVFDWAALKGKFYTYFGLDCSPALVSVGYIVGFRIALLVFLGGVISWWIAIPLYVFFTGVAPAVGQSAIDFGFGIWNNQIRYLGAGAMLAGGLWAVISIRGSLSFAVKQGLAAFGSSQDQSTLPRTEKDTPMKWVLAGIAFMIIPIFLIYNYNIGAMGIAILMSLIMIVAGFLFSAVAGYMAGLVGSSNNPISGVTIATILVSSLLLVLLLGSGSGKGPAAAIMIGAVVCCAAAIAGDNMQDLKAGNILGATPYKQQIMQIIGVVTAALVIPFVLDSLNSSYGFGMRTAARPDALAAPQASLMQSVADGVFGGNLPWPMIYAGIGLGILIILLDQFQLKRGSSFRIPVLAVAVGLYLPFELDSAIMLGGLIAWFVDRQTKNATKESKAASEQDGLLFASGLITGEALMGIVLAVYVGVKGGGAGLVMSEHPIEGWLALILIMIIAFLMFRAGSSALKKRS